MNPLAIWQAASATVRALVIGAAALLLALAVWFVIDRLFLAPGRDAAALAAARATATVSSAEAKAGAAAADIVAKNGTKNASIDEKTRANYVTIIQQAGADAPVSDASFDAFLRAVCLRDAAAGDPQCLRLRQPDP